MAHDKERRIRKNKRGGAITKDRPHLAPTSERPWAPQQPRRMPEESAPPVGEYDEVVGMAVPDTVFRQVADDEIHDSSLIVRGNLPPDQSEQRCRCTVTITKRATRTVPCKIIFRRSWTMDPREAVELHHIRSAIFAQLYIISSFNLYLDYDQDRWLKQITANQICRDMNLLRAYVHSCAQNVWIPFRPASTAC